jgi:tRNA pseudouridine55 synthase
VFGFLNVNKPLGISSRQTVDQFKPFVFPEKIGHAGTLDPLATGVLVIAIGPATRLIPHLHEFPKTYVASFRLGCTNPSLDLETEVQTLADRPVPNQNQIEDALQKFIGEIPQKPPIYSAIKVDGKRVYDLARQGQSVEVSERTVVIHEIKLLSFNYPVLEIETKCSTGTYIRSLGSDIAKSLGSDAVMTKLCRTAIGPFQIENAIEANVENRQQIERLLQTPQLAVSDLTQVSLSQQLIERIRNGTKIDLTDLAVGPQDFPDRFVGVDNDGRLIAVFCRAKDRRYRPALNFVSYYDKHGIPI